MISQTTEYALRAVVALADAGDQQMTTEQLSQVTRVPLGYLAKVMQQLAKAGVVVSRRGLHGGFRLQGDAKTLTMLDVVSVVQPMQRHKSCPLNTGNPMQRHQEQHGNGTELCPLHHRLDDLISIFEKELQMTTIGALLASKNSPNSLCANKKQS